MIPTGIQSLLPPGQQGMAQQPPPPGMGGPQQLPGGLGIGSAVGSVNEYVDMYKTDPDPLLEQYGADGDFFKLVALQKIKSLQEAFANDYAMQMERMNAANGQDAPMTTQVENEVVSNAMQGMGPPMQGVGPSMPGSEPEYEGMLGLPIDNSGRMTGAGGGIVAFANGTGRHVIDDFIEQTSPHQERTLSLEELLIRQLTAGMEGGTGTESPVTQYNLDQAEAGKFRDQREENWKARQDMLAEQQDPERRRQERIDQAIHAAATTYGGIGEMGARIAEGDRRRADAYEDFDLGVLEGEGAHIDEQLAELLETQSGRRTLEKDFNTSEDEALAQVLSSSTTLIQSQKQLEAALAQVAKTTNQGDYVNWRVDLARIVAGGQLSPEQEAQEKVAAAEEYAVLSTDATGQATVARIDAQREENWLDARQDAEEAVVEGYMQISGGNREFQDAMAVGDQPTMNRLMGDGMAWWEGRNPDPRPGARAPAPTPTSVQPISADYASLSTQTGMPAGAIELLLNDPSPDSIRQFDEQLESPGMAQRIIDAALLQ